MAKKPQTVEDILSSAVLPPLPKAPTEKLSSVDEALNVVRGKKGPKLREEPAPLSLENNPAYKNFIDNQALYKSPEEFNQFRQQQIDKAKKDLMMPIPGRKSGNLGPESGVVWFRLPNGTFDKRPRGQELPKGAVPINRTAEEIEAAFPPPREVPKPAPAPIEPAPTVDVSQLMLQNPQPKTLSERINAGMPTIDGRRLVIPEIPGRPAALDIARKAAPPPTSAQDAAVQAAIESNQAARAARAAENASQSEIAAAVESRASAMNPPAPAPRTPTREPNLGLPLGVAGLAGTGAMLGQQRGDIYGFEASRRAADERARMQAEADEASRQEAGYGTPAAPNTPAASLPAVGMGTAPIPGGYVGDAGFDVGAFPAQTDISQFSREDYVPPSYGKVPDILAPVVGGNAARAVQTARQTANRVSPTQMAMAAADNPNASPSMLSRLASAIYDPNYQKGMSSKQMFEQMQRDPRGELSFAQEESPAAYFRAAQRAKEEGEGRASGGKAGSGAGSKDAAMHKALEIIHMMLSRR